MSDEITITRKYVIYPIASDMKEWERKVIKYVSENYEKRIQLLEQKIKHSKIPKEEKENLRKELDNLKIKYDAFQADPAITQSEINTYTYGTVRTAMERPDIIHLQTVRYACNPRYVRNRHVCERT